MNKQGFDYSVGIMTVCFFVIFPSGSRVDPLVRIKHGQSIMNDVLIMIFLDVPQWQATTDKFLQNLQASLACNEPENACHQTLRRCWYYKQAAAIGLGKIFSPSLTLEHFESSHVYVMKALVNYAGGLTYIAESSSSRCVYKILLTILCRRSTCQAGPERPIHGIYCWVNCVLCTMPCSFFSNACRHNEVIY